MTSSTITGALVVCVAAAGIAVGALALEPGDTPSAAPVAPAAGAGGTAPASATPAPAGGGGYGSSDTGATGAAAAPDAPAAASLEISGFQFGTATVGAGGQVTASNRDGAPHTVTAEGGAFDSGQITAGGTATFTAPSQPGTYTFFCQIHPDMSGSLTVL